MSIKLSSLIALLFQTFAFFIGFSQEKIKTEYFYDETSKLNLKLSGQVKYLKEITENLKNEVTEEREFFFDLKGQPIKIIESSLDIDVMTMELRNENTVFSFKDGNLISQLNQIGLGLDGYTFQYNKNNSVTQKRCYVENRIISEEIYEYDENNRKIKFVKYVFGYFRDYGKDFPPNKEDFISEYKTYEYNEFGNLIVENTHTKNGNIYEKIIFTFDGNGNKIEEGRCKPFIDKNSKTINCNYKPLYGWNYDENNQMIKSFQLADFSPHNTDTYYKYDNKGREIESKGYYIYKNSTVGVLGYHFNYVYDNFGNKIKDEEVFGKYRSLGFERYKTENKEYDEFQNIILQEFIRSDDKRIKIVKYKYQYDDFGNWIERRKKEGKTHADLELSEIKTRSIIYYN